MSSLLTLNKLQTLLLFFIAGFLFVSFHECFRKKVEILENPAYESILKGKHEKKKKPSRQEDVKN